MAICAVGIVSGTLSQAAVIDVNGGVSSYSDLASIIAAPAQITNSVVFNRAQQGFNEMQGVLLGAGGVLTDQGAVGANMRVDSHMIFLNREDGLTANLGHFGVRCTFSGQILGVMSDSNGNLEAASTALLGAPGSTHEAPFTARGMESNNGGGGPFPNDGYTINGNFLTVGMSVTQPGDWIRVVTVSAVPVPAAMPLLLAGLGGLGFVARRKKRKAA